MGDMGLNLFQEVTKKVSTDKLIDEALKICHNPDFDSIRLQQNQAGPWNHFNWAFGNVWRDHYRRTNNTDRDVAATFSLTKVLSEEQMKKVANDLGIKGAYKNPFAGLEM